MSDYHLLETATLPHGLSYRSGEVMLASIDHAMWFHRPLRVDEWLLYACEPEQLGVARACLRTHLRPARPAGRQHRAGRPDA